MEKLQKVQLKANGLHDPQAQHYVFYFLNFFSVLFVLVAFITASFPIYTMTLSEAIVHYNNLFMTSLSGGSFLTVIMTVLLVVEIVYSGYLLFSNKPKVSTEDPLTNSVLPSIVNIHIGLIVIFWAMGWPWASFSLILVASIVQGLSYLGVTSYIYQLLFQRLHKHNSASEKSKVQGTESGNQVHYIMNFIGFNLPRIALLAYLISIAPEFAFGAYKIQGIPEAGWNQDKWFALNHAFICFGVIIASIIKFEPFLPGLLGLQLFTQYEYLRLANTNYAWYTSLVLAFVYMIASVMIGISRIMTLKFP